MSTLAYRWISDTGMTFSARDVRGCPLIDGGQMVDRALNSYWADGRTPSVRTTCTGRNQTIQSFSVVVAQARGFSESQVELIL